jgi:RimJ/RimL family protein N-acetyltransferase
MLSPPNPFPLHTPRLILRRFTASDAAAFLAYRTDPRIAQYQSWENYDWDQADAFVRHHALPKFGEPGEWLQIAVALVETNELIGDCAVRVHSNDVRQATIGGSLARRYHKQGFAVEALSCLLDSLFTHLQLHRVIADTDVENTAAWKLMEQVGLRREGHLKQSLWFKGRWVDEYLYSICRDEWQDRPRNPSVP